MPTSKPSGIQVPRGSVYTQKTGLHVGNHAVLLIGWDDTRQAFLLKNSWGATGGPNGDGTFWMAYTGHSNYLDFYMANMQIYPFLPCGYTEQTASYDFVELASLPPDQVQELQTADDSLGWLYPPFPLIFYCQQYGDLIVDSNGVVHLSDPVLSSGNTNISAYYNCSLPSSTWAGPLLAPFWMNLVPGYGPAYGKIYSAVTGTGTREGFDRGMEERPSEVQHRVIS